MATQLKQCPFCKSDIPKDASTCRYCAKGVSTVAMIGQGCQGVGCLLTLFVTVPIVLLFLFYAAC